MATVTPNFNWPVPTSTDLVKDGATAIEALGDSIDASLVDLKGGTTGQVLSKASGTDMDFTWVAQDDSNAIQNTIVDAKGDLISATAADTPARLAVGTNGQVLTADSAEATGLKWTTPATVTSGLTFISKTTITATSVATINNAFSSSYDNYLVKMVFDANSSAGGDIALRLNPGGGAGDVISNYASQRLNASSTTVAAVRDTGATSWNNVGYIDSASGSYASFDITFYAPFLTKATRITSFAAHDYTGSTQSSLRMFTGGNSNATSYPAFSIYAGGGSTNATVYIYGMANS